MEFANEKLPEYGDLLEKASYLDGNFSDWSIKKRQISMLRWRSYVLF
jgi:hypothetical protein